MRIACCHSGGVSEPGACPYRVVVLDIRFPTLPVAELSRHQACVNAVAWAPHSSCHICTAGDDRQALIWDLSAMGPNPATDAGSLGAVCPPAYYALPLT